MMENTIGLKIESVKRVHGRATLTLENGESYCMPRAMLRERPYRSGMLFDKGAFDAFLHERAYPFALEKAISLLASRNRTEKEIADILKRNAYPEKTIARVMSRLRDAGYLNDADFAEHWASSRTGKGMGIRRIRMELRQKGISQDEIDTAVSSVDETEILAGAIKIAEKASRGKDLQIHADRQRIIAALLRRGYEFSMAKKALDQLLSKE